MTLEDREKARQMLFQGQQNLDELTPGDSALFTSARENEEAEEIKEASTKSRGLIQEKYIEQSLDLNIGETEAQIKMRKEENLDDNSNNVLSSFSNSMDQEINDVIKL